MEFRVREVDTKGKSFSARKMEKSSLLDRIEEFPRDQRYSDRDTGLEIDPQDGVEAFRASHPGDRDGRWGVTLKEKGRDQWTGSVPTSLLLAVLDRYPEQGWKDLLQSWRYQPGFPEVIEEWLKDTEWDVTVTDDDLTIDTPDQHVNIPRDTIVALERRTNFVRLHTRSCAVKMTTDGALMVTFE